ncbi:M57 family metalloprotease [Nocardioides sambongensis]|uniref:M57 family metalloprotease n=1 Tax=Nocardioides sambongensis TaxID=2589074 RepID=UPI0018C87CFD|nr:M57 family metalloprotease [Nocardioides sambongensis]
MPTFKEFKASTYRDADGQYIVNGDEPLKSTGQLKKFYEAMVAQQQTPENGLVVNTVNGVDDAWSDSEVGALSYCVSDDFGTDHAAMVDAMADGAGLWESASSAIDFVYVSAEDGDCTTSNSAVTFSVEPVNTSQYIARAFFPSSSKSVRNVLVDDSIWDSGTWEPGDILGHELGHALGFRHEHTRPEAGTCFEDNNWRPLTPYDGASIMHYPQCNGASSDLEFSDYDVEGVQELYGY